MATVNFNSLEVSNETMSVTNKKQHMDESVTAKNDVDFKREEVPDLSLTEGEEDSEVTVKTIEVQAEADAAAAPRPSAASIIHQPEAVDDFLRNFLFQMGMTETLDCFETEWTEMAQRGLLATEQVGVVPEVYTENERLDRELKNARREAEEHRLALSAMTETLSRLQKARDLHRLQHKRVVQEKNRVIEEIRKLKVQCNSYEPVVKRMNEKYEAVLKQTMLATMQMDKALGRASGQSAEQDRRAECQKGNPSSDPTTTSNICKYPKDTDQGEANEGKHVLK